MEAHELPAWRFLKYRNQNVFCTVMSYSQTYVVPNPVPRHQHRGPGKWKAWVDRTDGSEKDTLLYGGLIFDLDRDPLDRSSWLSLQQEVSRLLNSLDKLWGLHPEKVRLDFSGSKGVHILIAPEVFGIEPRNDLHVGLKVLAESIRRIARIESFDPKVYDPRRVLRLTNSIHSKSGRFSIPLTADELLGWSLDRLFEEAKGPRPIPEIKDVSLLPKARADLLASFEQAKRPVSPKRPVTVQGHDSDLSVSYVPPCIAELMTGPLRKGVRNESCLILASFFYQQGKSFEAVLKWLLEEWNTERVMELPLLSHDEIIHAVEMVYQHGYKAGCNKISEVTDCERSDCKLCMRKAARRIPV